jgi:hypothetical protein
LYFGRFLDFLVILSFVWEQREHWAHFLGD